MLFTLLYNYSIISHQILGHLIQKNLKPFVKGKIYQGFASGVKKFIKKRGGKV